MGHDQSSSPPDALQGAVELGTTLSPTVTDCVVCAPVASTLPAEPSLSWPRSATMSERAKRARSRGAPSSLRRDLIVAAAVFGSVTGLFVGLGTSPSAGAAQSASTSGFSGDLGSGGQGSNARSGPAPGGSTGIRVSHVNGNKQEDDSNEDPGGRQN
jgi:hypothetical protein